jgi:hypothetical protein
MAELETKVEGRQRAYLSCSLELHPIWDSRHQACLVGQPWRLQVRPVERAAF